MASWYETEESWNGRMRRISTVHKHTVTAGESEDPKDHRREKIETNKTTNGPQLSHIRRSRAIRRKKKDSTQVASCCETEESWNGRVHRASDVH